MAQMGISVHCEDGDDCDNIFEEVRVVDVKVFPPAPPTITFDGEEEACVSDRLKPGSKTSIGLWTDDDYELRINGVTAKVTAGDGTRIDLEI